MHFFAILVILRQLIFKNCINVHKKDNLLVFLLSSYFNAFVCIARVICPDLCLVIIYAMFYVPMVSLRY